MSTPRVVVLISGEGTNLQAILDACADGRLAAEVVRVISNRKSAGGLARANRAGVDVAVLSHRDFDNREAFDRALADLVDEAQPDWVFLAGFMRIVTDAFIHRFEGRLLNLHPALPGDLVGTRAIERAFEEAQRGKRDGSGVMVHHVTAEVDRGEPVVVERVPVHADDTLASFADRMHAVEQRLVVDALNFVMTTTHSAHSISATIIETERI